MHAAELSANERLRGQVAALARSGAPVVAECAGLLYLVRELDGQPMCGVLDATARMTPRLTLGYREATAMSDGLVPAGAPVAATSSTAPSSTPAAGATPAWSVDERPEGFAGGHVHASYLHLHWAAQPRIAARLVRRAARHAGVAA